MLRTSDDSDPLWVRLILGTQHPAQADSLTATLKPLLLSLDPDMTYIRVMTPARMATEMPGTKMSDIETLVKMNCTFSGNHTGVHSSHVISQTNSHLLSPRSPDAAKPSDTALIQTPSLSVSLFLKESSVVSASGTLQRFKGPPWRFHHKIELSNARGSQMKVIGRQEFHSCGGGSSGMKQKQLPLWAVCPVHCGNEHLRFTIFTQHFSAMVDFYRLLIGHEAEFTRPNFCLFTIGSMGSGRDIQLAVKWCEQLKPIPLTSSFLTFRVPSVRVLEGLIHTPNGTAGTVGHVGESLWLLRDPDFNCVLVEEVAGSVNSPSPSLSLFSSDTQTTTSPATIPRSTPRLPLSRSAVIRSPRSPLTGSPRSPAVTTPHPCNSTRIPDLRVTGDSLSGYSPTSGVGCLRRWVSSPSDMEVGMTRPELPALPRLPWSDLSSWDSGWHSSHSDPETGDSESVVSDVETCSSSMTGVLLCECDAMSNGRCLFCVRTKRANDVIIQNDVIFTKNGVTGQNTMGRMVQASPVHVKRRPWEVDAIDLSHKEWEDLISLSDTNDPLHDSSRIDLALSALNINLLT